jgi:hypothetical protein
MKECLTSASSGRHLALLGAGRWKLRVFYRHIRFYSHSVVR